MKKHLIFTCLFIMAWGTIFAQDFYATINSKKVGLNENFQVNFTIENANGKNFKAPNFDPFQVLSGPNQSTNMQIINGRMTKSVTFSYILRPTKEGTFTIPPASIEIKGETQNTKPIPITVEKGAGGESDLMTQIAENVFLRAIVSDYEVYQGEQLSITYKLYTRMQLMNLSISENPSFTGFWTESLDVTDNNYSTEELDGVQYNVATIQRYALFPQKVGELTIDPLKLECYVRVQAKQNQPRSIFDDFFGSSYENVPFKFGNQPIKIQVKPLPASGKPSDFNGIVGQFEMEVTADKTTTETDDPITFKMEIKGQGNLKMLDQPELELPSDFEVYDPQMSESTYKGGSRVTSKKTYDYLVIPRRPGTYKLPPITFSFFDPVKEEYVTLSSEEFQITVEGEPIGDEQTVTNLSKSDVEKLGEDIRFIHTDEIEFQEKGAAFIKSPIFIASYVMPFLLFPLFMGWYRRREAILGDATLMKKRGAGKVARKRLKHAKDAMDKNDSKAFHDAVVQAIWGFIGDRLSIPPSELSRDKAREVLTDAGVTNDEISAVLDLVEHCEMAVFAPGAVSGDMGSTYDKAADLITKLDSDLS